MSKTQIWGTGFSHDWLITKKTLQLSDTSTTTYDICKAKPKEMNLFEKLSQRRVLSDKYRFGFSSFHTCMECFLHVFSRLDFKYWQAKDDDLKELLATKNNLCEIILEVRCTSTSWYYEVSKVQEPQIKWKLQKNISLILK